VTWEAMFGGAAKVLVSSVLNRFAKAPDIWLSYGKSGSNDLVRMHYQRPDGPRPAHPWIIIEARCLWPIHAPLYASDAEAVARAPALPHHAGLHLKPGSGVFFIPLRDGQEFPPSVHMLLKVERAVPGERRWVVARALRPSKFDLRADADGANR
jgi:hypothetical protein